jgi:flagellar basal-body rod protein FlgB
MDGGLVSPALRVALDGLAARQRVIANNVANIQTPGFTAQDVTFEAAMASALGSDPGASVSDLASTLAVASTTDAAREDGNNVSLERETLLGSETNLRYSLALRAVEGRFTTMRDVLKGS